MNVIAQLLRFGLPGSKSYNDALQSQHDDSAMYKMLLWSLRLVFGSIWIISCGLVAAVSVYALGEKHWVAAIALNFGFAAFVGLMGFLGGPKNAWDMFGLALTRTLALTIVGWLLFVVF